MKKENVREKNIEETEDIEESQREEKEESKQEEIKQVQANAEKEETQKETEIKKSKNIAKRKKEPKKNKKLILSIVIISIIIVIAFILSTILALLNINKTNIVSGVKIKGIEVSGLSKEEAKGKLEMIYKEKLEKEIQIKYQDYESSINANMLETKYNIDEAVEQAINVGRNNNIFINNYEILWAMLGKKDIDINMELNEEISQKAIEDIGTNLPGVVEESAYYIEDNKLIITKGKAGIKINTDELLEKIKENLRAIETTNEYITIPVINKEPQAIDIDKIHSEVYKEVKDAYYTKDPFTIYPEVDGIDFNVEEAKKKLEEDREEYIIDLTITKAKITTNQIGTEAFPDELAIFKTNYDGGNRDRTTNLILACEKINGKVLLAGETFSYNQTLGARTATAGYKNAKVYSNGEVVDGIGGRNMSNILNII